MEENKQIIPYQVNNSFAYCTLKYKDDWYIKMALTRNNTLVCEDITKEMINAHRVSIK